MKKTLLSLFVLSTLALTAQAQGRGQGMGMGGPKAEMQQKDMETIHTLFAAHQKIKRTVTPIKNGVETATESEDAATRKLIVEHVAAMKARLEKKQPIRMWDPLFVELFKHADKIKLEIVPTAKGVKVVETSDDPYVVKLIQAHAQGVSEFVKEGMPSMHKRHELPGAEPAVEKFLGKGDGVTTCPVPGEPVNKNISAVIGKKTVYFCCEGCKETVQKNPALYLKDIQ